IRPHTRSTLFPYTTLFRSPRSLALLREDGCELLRRDDLELRKGAVARILVRAPPAKLGSMAEAAALHVIVGDLDDELGTQRLPRSEEHTSELQSRFDLVCR